MTAPLPSYMKYSACWVGLVAMADGLPVPTESDRQQMITLQSQNSKMLTTDSTQPKLSGNTYQIKTVTTRPNDYDGLGQYTSVVLPSSAGGFSCQDGPSACSDRHGDIHRSAPKM